MRFLKPKQDQLSLFDGFHRGVPGGAKPAAAQEAFPSAETLAGMARFRFDPKNPRGMVPVGAVGARMEQMRLRNGRIGYAAMGGSLLGVDDDRHHVLIAGSRSFKGRSRLLAHLITDTESSFLAFTPKGDHARETALWRSKVLGQKVFVVDGYGTAGSGCEGLHATLNPLQHVDRFDPDAVVEAATNIAAAIVVPSLRGDSHWDDTAQEWIEAVCMHVMTADKFEGRRNLGTVRHEIMANADAGGSLAKDMVASNAAYGAVSVGAVSFFGKEDRERSGTLSTARRHLKFIGYPKVEAMLQDGPLNLDDLLTHKMTVYVCLPATMLGPAAGFLRLFVSLALAGFEKNEARHAHQHQTGGHRCHMLLDEYASMGRLKVLESAAGQVAGLGCSLHVILQDLSQLKATHPDTWETFLGNAGTVSLFGNTDTTTLEWGEKRLGTTEVRNASRRNPSLRQAVGDGELGASYSVNTHPLMTMAEMARTFDRDDPLARQLVFLPSVGPVIAQKVLYDKHEAFAPYRDWMASHGS